MPERVDSGKLADEPKIIDPIAFGDEIIYGLDPAVHWVQWNNQREQFPEIVLEITNHWDDSPWLEKLLNRYGYNLGVFNRDTNPKGIFEIPPQRGGAVYAMHYVLLRFAGVKTAVLSGMFSLVVAKNRPANRSVRWRFASEPLQEAMEKRRQLATQKHI